MSLISKDFTTNLETDHISTTFKPSRVSLQKMKKKRVEIWLFSGYQKILLGKDLFLLQLLMDTMPKYLTITSSTLEKALDKIEKKWGIIAEPYDLQFVTSVEKTPGRKIYILSLELTPEQETFVQDISKSKFYDITDNVFFKNTSSTLFDVIRNYAMAQTSH